MGVHDDAEQHGRLHTADAERYSRFPRHVLHLTLSFAPGGRRDAIVTLSRELRRLGVSSSLAVLRDDGIPLDGLSETFTSVSRIATSGLPSFSSTAQLLRHCNTIGVDVLHAHDSSSQFAAAVAKLVAPKLHSVMTFHRSRPIDSGGTRNKIRNTISMARTDLVATASHERRRHLLKHTIVTPSKIEVLPLGVDVVRFRPDPSARAAVREELDLAPSTALLVAIGHFGTEKGLDRAIAGVAEARRRAPQQRVVLAILGTGAPDRAAELRRIAADQLGTDVHFLGQRADPERWLAGADILVHAPRAEAFGLVLVQGMACGVPVVAVGVGGVPDIVQHRETGWLIEPTSEPSGGMADGILWLLENPDELRRVATTARHVAETRFSSEAYSERYLRWYQRLADGRAA